MAYGDGPPAAPLADFVEAVRATYAALGALRVTPGDGLIEWIDGAKYEAMEGAPPRIWVKSGDGTLGAPDRIGQMFAGSLAETCSFHLWGAEGDTDASQKTDAKSMLVRLLNVLRLRGPGRLKTVTVVWPSPTNILEHGAECRVDIRYTWQIPRDGAVWAIALTPASPPDPMKPNGPTGVDFSLDLTPAVER